MADRVEVRIARLLLCIIGGIGIAGAQASLSGAKPAAPSASAAPQDPLDRTSPQSAVVAFLDAYRAKDYAKATRYLDLKKLHAEGRSGEAPELARELGDILDRDAQFDIATLSRISSGEPQTGVAPDRQRVTAFQVDGKTLDVELERTEFSSGLSVWRFTPQTVDLIPQLSVVTSDSPIERHLPPILVRWTFIDTALWRWIALLVLAIALWFLSKVISAVVLSYVLPALSKVAQGAKWELVRALLGPCQLLLATALFGAGMHWINPSSILRLYLGHTLTFLSLCGAVWLGARLVDFAAARIRRSLERNHKGALVSVFPLAARVLKLTILVFGITGVLKDWGRDTTTILTGLGIGGIAIALASQKTIENLFGSVAVITDRPVHVGDFCKFGNQMGTVEDIGLRSTRIRTVDRTVVTVPNGEFSTMTLENFSPRDKTPLHHVLNLRRDATPDQVRAILQNVSDILKAQPKVEPSDFPVRFTGVGQYSLDVEIFTYILTGDGDEFLRIQQDLLLKILDAVKAAGTALALPTQASVQYKIDRPPVEPATQRPQ